MGERAIRLTALGVGVLGLLLLVVVARQVGATDPLPIAPDPVVLSVDTGADDAVDVVWLGDTLVGEAAQPDIDRLGWDWPFAELGPLLAGDLTILNLEAPLTDRRQAFLPGQTFTYNAQPAAADALAAVGVDVAGLANNHALDRGPEGLADTIEAAEAAGIEVFGAGETAVEARRPVMIDTPAGRLAVLGFTDNGGSVASDGLTAGVRELTDSAVRADFALARRMGADWVVAYVHWGENYAAADARQRDFAQMFADSTYDLVIGHGSHSAQRIEFVDGMPVVYSLGNFVFGTPGRFAGRADGYGLVLTTEIRTDRSAELVLACIEVDNSVVRYQPRPCPGDEAEAMLAGLHPDIAVAGNEGRLDCRCLLPVAG